MSTCLASSARSISVLLISLFTYLSEFHLDNDHIVVHELLTRATLLDLNDHLRHFCGQWHLCVHLETPEEHFDAPKDVSKSFMARPNVHRCLRTVYVRMTHTKEWRIRTERRTPILAKTTVAGENACQIYECGSVQISKGGCH